MTHFTVVAMKTAMVCPVFSLGNSALVRASSAMSTLSNAAAFTGPRSVFYG